MFSRIPLILKGITPLLFMAAAQAAEQQINNPAPAWDHLWHEVLIDITIIGVLFSLVIVYFVFKYRRTESNQVGQQPKLSPAMAVGWALIPAFIFMADDFYLAANGWEVWNYYRQVPADRMEVKLESGMYSWDYTYPNGVQTQNELRVPAGKPIMLRMTSRDTLHSHYIPDFRVKEDSMPGRVTYLWFYPEKPGEHIVTCTEYCGIMHSYMVGKVIAMPPAEFNTWYEAEATKLAVAINGTTNATTAENATAIPSEPTASKDAPSNNSQPLAATGGNEAETTTPEGTPSNNPQPSGVTGNEASTTPEGTPSNNSQPSGATGNEAEA